VRKNNFAKGGLKKVVIFDWYFYPEFADRTCFKGRHN